MEQDLRTTLRACADLIRMDLALGAGAFLVAGEIVAYQGLPPLDEVVLGFASLFFIAGSANISNDYFDREVDRINLPSRPLPSGRITARGLWALFLLFSAAGLLAAALLSGPVLVLVAVFWAISVLYNFRLKEYGFFGNVV
ncbi:MAG TPA: UbiA family prenyltransferase, partial [Methanoregulaceae archaeon]|nr:UbiA family prenyltransferase [Methanoregulaceae archaeon]